MSIVHLRNKIFWDVESSPCQECVKDIDVEVAVIGGGITGLSAAQAFAQRGKKVALFEKDVCGSGATGKSGGFITPNAELSLSDFAKQTDVSAAQNIWKFINRGLEQIRSNITTQKFNCDYNDHRGLFIANCNRTLQKLQEEHNNILKLGYESHFYDKQQLKRIVNSDIYSGAMTYDNSFGIDPYLYCAELKKHLVQKGVQVFENTPVSKIDDHVITTSKAKITANYIVVCLDRFSPDIGVLQDDIYHAQNHVLLSQPLTNQQVASIFPQKKYMVWDTQLIYNYYRIIKDNRLLIGGGDIFSVYLDAKHNYKYGRKKLSNYIKKAFPQVEIEYEYQWPGLIGISKDISPLAGPDKKHPHVYYIAASAGLPVGTTLGMYSAEYLLDNRKDMDDYFTPDRKYFIGKYTQKILGKKLSFAINNFMSQDTVGCF